MLGESTWNFFFKKDLTKKKEWNIRDARDMRALNFSALVSR